MRVSPLLGLASIAFVATACSPAPAKPAAPTMDPAAMRSAISDAIARVDTAFMHRDTVALAAFYAPDAMMVTSGGVAHGTAEIVSAVKQFFATYDSAQAEPEAIDAFFPVDSTDAVVFSHVQYTLFVKGKKMPARANYAARHFLKGADGMWRAHHEYNTDVAVEAAPAMKPAMKKP